MTCLNESAKSAALKPNPGSTFSDFIPEKSAAFFNGTIKAYFASHPELDDYDQGYGFSVQHNWGKAPISELPWLFR
ncbi:MAG: hypothetical protein AAGF93_10930 [Cyanobacteria bacterium P01_H01_bin.105]